MWSSSQMSSTVGSECWPAPVLARVVRARRARQQAHGARHARRGSAVHLGTRDWAGRLRLAPYCRYRPRGRYSRRVQLSRARPAATGAAGGARCMATASRARNAVIRCDRGLAAPSRRRERDDNYRFFAVCNVL